MKKIEAYIKPERLEDVKEALKNIHFNGLSISQIMGCGSQMGWQEFVRGSAIEYNFLPKIKIELVVCDDQAETVVSQIVAVTRTGEVGDGKIFISEILDAVRIRTGERGEMAIT